VQAPLPLIALASHRAAQAITFLRRTHEPNPDQRNLVFRRQQSNRQGEQFRQVMLPGDGQQNLGRISEYRVFLKAHSVVSAAT
jgi:hypothetical protein